MSAEENAGNRVPRTPENLFVRTNKQLQDFWQTIVRKFVEDVDPESFTDELYPDELLTHTSQESLAAGKDGRPRTDRARALWRVLSKHSLEVFRSKIAPKLCESYDWIIPQIFFATQEQQMKIMSLTLETDNPCLRHAVQKRLRPETMADLLLSHHCMSMDEHSSIVFGDPVKYSTEMTWDIIFGAFTKVSEDNSGKLLAETKALLERYLVGIPENFPEILHHAFPCACQTPGSCPSPSATEPNEKVQLMFERRLAAGRQPSLLSLDSSCTSVDMSTCSLYSSIRPDSEADTSSIGSAGQFFDKESLGSSDTNINNRNVATPFDGRAGETEALLSQTSGLETDDELPLHAGGKLEACNQHTTAPRGGSTVVLLESPNVTDASKNTPECNLHFKYFVQSDSFCDSYRYLYSMCRSCVLGILRKVHLADESQLCYRVFRMFLLILMIFVILSAPVIGCLRAYGAPAETLEKVWIVTVGFWFAIIAFAECVIVILGTLVISCKLVLCDLFKSWKSTRMYKQYFTRKPEEYMI